MINARERKQETAEILPPTPSVPCGEGGIGLLPALGYLTQSQGSLPPQWSQEHCLFMFAQVQCTAYFFGSALNFARQLSAQK